MMERYNSPSSSEKKLQESLSKVFNPGKYSFFSQILRSEVLLEIYSLDPKQQFISIKFEDNNEIDNTSITLLQEIPNIEPTIVATNYRSRKDKILTSNSGKINQYYTGQSKETTNSLSIVFLNQLADVIIESQLNNPDSTKIAC